MKENSLEAQLHELLARRAAEDVVLFVDDEPNVLEGLQRTLMDEPYRILTAPGGREALEILRSTRVTLVVSDQDMPGMRGLDLLREVAAHHPRTVRFLLTGKATLELALAAINEGEVHRFYTKPCPSETLAQGIREGLRFQRLQELACDLLQRNNQHETLLGRLEQKHPGITEVRRDESGAIVLDDIE